MNPDHRLSAQQITQISQIAKRRKKGEPVAYILGYKNFFGHRLKVKKHVLVPRPETEGLVDLMIERLKDLKIGRQKFIKILDVGTGSGCIIISLARVLSKQYPVNRFEFYASDVSLKALKVAKANAKQHKVKVKFIHSDLFKNIESKFDIVVANLPYVPARYLKIQNSKLKTTTKSLKFEPKMGLTDGTNDWGIYQTFLNQVPKVLNTKYQILMEIDPQSKLLLTKWINKYLPKTKFKFYKDLQGLWRYAIIRS